MNPSKIRVNSSPDELDSILSLLELNQVRAAIELLTLLRVKPLSEIQSQFQNSMTVLSQKLGKSPAWEWKGFHRHQATEHSEITHSILLHSLRNALDHGVAADDTNPKITVRLDLDCGQWVLSIHNTGKGPDFRAITDRALELSLIDSSDAASATSEEKLAWLFVPGFTTKKEATEVSGRGVGLDALSQWLRDAGGNIFARGEKDQGFTLITEFPAKVLLTQAVQATARNQTFWIESESIHALREILPLEVQGETESRILFRVNPGVAQNEFHQWVNEACFGNSLYAKNLPLLDEGLAARWVSQ
jgi:chemotaxis protein histidine kinase CheA